MATKEMAIRAAKIFGKFREIQWSPCLRHSMEKDVYLAAKWFSRGMGSDEEIAHAVACAAREFSNMSIEQRRAHCGLPANCAIEGPEQAQLANGPSRMES